MKIRNLPRDKKKIAGYIKEIQKIISQYGEKETGLFLIAVLPKSMEEMKNGGEAETESSVGAGGNVNLISKEIVKTMKSDFRKGQVLNEIVKGVNKGLENWIEEEKKKKLN